MLQGPLGFVVFWVAALAVGVLLVALVVGARFGWLLLAAVPAAALVMIAVRGRPQALTSIGLPPAQMPEQPDIERRP